MVLDDVDFSTSGQYRCDVSGDAPMFQTDSIEGLLFVVGKSIIHLVLDSFIFFYTLISHMNFRISFYISLK